jgi:transposase
VNYQALDGNTTDDQTHRATWDVLRSIAGRADFLYVADAKLCTRANMRHIVERGGRFLTVLPATRKEDKRFQDWIRNHEVPWEEVLRRTNPLRKNAPPDIFRAYEDPEGSVEGYRIVWFHSTEKEKRDRQDREEKMDQAIRELRALKDRMASPRTRLRERNKLDEAIERILQECGASPWLEVEVGRKEDVRFRQVTAGRPGPHTRYRRVVRLGFDLAWRSPSNPLLYDERTDGIFPLVTSDRKLSPKQILQAYKLGQPGVEQRHHHLKAAHEVAPQYLKSVARIEAFLCVYFFALLVNALIEREIRQAMKRRRLRALPIYPESRPCKRPTTEQILKIFEGLMVHRLSSAGGPQHIYQPNLTRLQRQVLRLLGIQPQAYRIGME